MGERGRHEEGENERGERPERSVEVGRGVQVGGGVCGREGVERVDTAKEDLSSENSGHEKRLRRGLGGETAQFWCQRRSDVDNSLCSRRMYCQRQKCNLRENGYV